MVRPRKRTVVLTALLSSWAVAWAIFIAAVVGAELPGWVLILVAYAVITPIVVVRVLRQDVRRNTRLSEEDRRRWASRLRWWGPFAGVGYARRAME